MDQVNNNVSDNSSRLLRPSFLILITIWSFLILSAGEDDILSIPARWDSSRGGNYIQPGREELNKAEELFRRTLQLAQKGLPLNKEELTGLQKAWLDLNFGLIHLKGGANDLLVLEEEEEHKTGRGFYVFRSGQPKPILLQAPHSFSDLNTGEIALNLFQESQAVAVATNTVSRKEADLAHMAESYFQSISTAFAKNYPEGIVIQLHGFSKKKRKSTSASEAEMVISDGSKTPSPWLRQTAKCLKRAVALAFPPSGRPGVSESGADLVKLYPYEVRDLGATRNTQAQLLRGLGYDGFIHIEMSAAFRKLMHKDSITRQELLKCLPKDRK